MSSSATVMVEKATSDLLIGPDWTLNMEICDSVNLNNWQAKDVLKAVKKRLQHKKSNIQSLTLTLLEAMVKNCGDFIHFQIADGKILQEMVKVVKKKTNIQVRAKILALIDSWQEAFGGPNGRYPQYYWAYVELKHSGIEFPKRPVDAVPIFMPPVSNPSFMHVQEEYVMPVHSSQRLDEAMASEIGCVTLSSIIAWEDAVDLLAEMLQAVKHTDQGTMQATEDELILDVVDQCRANQKKLIQTLNTSVDEALLGRGLELNDRLQNLLGRYDAISSGSFVHTEAGNHTSRFVEPHVSVISTSEEGSSSQSSLALTVLPTEEEEEDDDFTQLARRHYRKDPRGISGPVVENNQSEASRTSVPSIPPDKTSSQSLVPLDPPLQVKTAEEDLIDLLTGNLSSLSSSPHNPNDSSSPLIFGPSPNHEDPAQPKPNYQFPSQTYLQNGNYITPWARQPPLEVPQRPLPALHTQTAQQNYPPPPWETTYPSDQTPTTASHTRPLRHHNSFPTKGTSASPAPKPFIPSHRLFGDLDVFGTSRRGSIDRK